MSHLATKFDELSEDALVRLPVVRNLFSISSPTVWRWSKSGRLPPPIKISGITAWHVGALRKTLKEITALKVKDCSKNIDFNGTVK